MVGGTIGISLYAAQAISVSFYMIAFSQAFTPLFEFIQANAGILPDARMVSVPATLLLLYVIYRRGANIGVNALWVIVSILGISIASFLLGSPVDGAQHIGFFSTLPKPDSFFLVFAIVFPAFTGLTAGVGLSGDLKNPAKSMLLSKKLDNNGILGFLGLFLLGDVNPDSLSTSQFTSYNVMQDEVEVLGQEA